MFVQREGGREEEVKGGRERRLSKGSRKQEEEEEEEGEEGEEGKINLR